jgi:hypothetical protein
MVDFFRIVFLVSLLSFSVSSHSATYSWSASGYVFSDYTSACNYDGTLGSPPWTMGSFVMDSSQMWGKCYDQSGVYQVNVALVTDVSTSCPSGYTLNGSGQCVVNATCPPAGTAAPTPYQWFVGWSATSGDSLVTTFASPTSGNIPPSVCASSCSYTLAPSPTINCYAFPDALTKTYCSATYVSSGSSCTAGAGNPAPATPSSANPCPPGQVSGTVNGVQMCLAGGTTPAGTPSTTATTTTTAPVTNTTTGAVTTTTTTINNYGGSTTSTTVTQPNGAAATTTTKAGPQPPDPKQPNPFCTDNPTSPICLVSGFTASCTSLPACSGDAVQCAQAQAVWQTNCVINPQPSSISDLGAAAVAGNDPAASNFPNAASKLTTVDVGGIISGSAATRWLGSGDMTNPTFAVLGQSYTLNLGLLSNFLRAIGYIFVAVAGVIAARIIGG